MQPVASKRKYTYVTTKGCSLSCGWSPPSKPSPQAPHLSKGTCHSAAPGTAPTSTHRLSHLVHAPLRDGGSKQKEWRNPFLPYEEDLWVSHLSDTHTLLLNKFNVVPHHLLVVTRQFESQQDPLNAADLDATLQVRRLRASLPVQRMPHTLQQPPQPPAAGCPHTQVQQET